MNENEISEMIELAMQARTKAYAPYSNFQVGACIKMENGSYYTGCNIENASYGATNCAERTAVFGVVHCFRHIRILSYDSRASRIESLPGVSG